MEFLIEKLSMFSLLLAGFGLFFFLLSGILHLISLGTTIPVTSYEYKVKSIFSLVSGCSLIVSAIVNQIAVIFNPKIDLTNNLIWIPVGLFCIIGGSFFLVQYTIYTHKGIEIVPSFMRPAGIVLSTIGIISITIAVLVAK